MAYIGFPQIDAIRRELLLYNERHLLRYLHKISVSVDTMSQRRREGGRTELEDNNLEAIEKVIN